MTFKNARNQSAQMDSTETRPGFSPQNIIELTRQAITKAQSLALSSDKVIILRKPPANAMVFADPDKFLHGMGLLFANAIAAAPERSTIAVKIMFRSLQVMIALEDQGDGLDKDTVDQILADFDQVTWPDLADPTNVTILGNTHEVDRTALHIRKLASSEKTTTRKQVATSAVLTFPRIIFRQMT